MKKQEHPTIIKSELIEKIQDRFTDVLSPSDTEAAVNEIFSYMIEGLSQGRRIEIRGFGSFSLRHRRARIGRNPKTGSSVKVEEKTAVHFKPSSHLVFEK